MSDQDLFPYRARLYDREVYTRGEPRSRRRQFVLTRGPATGRPAG
jgi:hypothetical protein